MLRYCKELDRYTLQEEYKGYKTVNSSPPKYSPEDKYAKYRLQAKKEQGLL
ncbi:MAG: nucleolar RNA-binding Nop10p family protein [Candidatus Woesearchaeota archaeon]